MAQSNEDKHTYPDRYTPGPGQPWQLNVAWEIMDTIKPGVLTDDVRAFLAGQIVGVLMKHKAQENGKGAVI